MKALLITPTEIDFSSGGAQRSGYIHNAMQQWGDVRTLIVQKGASLSIDDGWAPEGIRRIRFTHEGYGPIALFERLWIRRRIDQILNEERFSAIVARYLSMAVLVPRFARSRLVIDADDAIKRSAAGAQFPARRRALLRLRNRLVVRALAHAAHIWFVNPHDAKQLSFEHKTLLRNVVQIPPETYDTKRPVYGRILMVGMFWHTPNAEGLEWFVRRVLPDLIERIPEIELHVVGHSGSHMHFGSERVKLRGFVPNLPNEYAQASLVVAPIHSGGGTQIKIVEALAHGRPLVASEFAYRGFAGDFRRDEHLLVAENPEEWVALCRWGLTQRAAAEEMAARGRAAMQPYSPATLTEIVTRTLQKLTRA
jgi:glycosyltransferase involved in cell wall biosynthesis